MVKVMEVASCTSSQNECFVKVMKDCASAEYLKVPKDSRWSTTILLKFIFHQIAVRRKSLNPAAELAAIKELIVNLSLLHHNVTWTFTDVSNNTCVFHSAGQQSVLKRIVSNYGLEVMTKMVEVCYSSSEFRLEGFLSAPIQSCCTWNKAIQSLYYDSRWMKNKDPISGIINSYYTRYLYNGSENGPNTKHANLSASQIQKFPLFILKFTFPADDVDFYPETDHYVPLFKNRMQLNHFILDFLRDAFEVSCPEFIKFIAEEVQLSSPIKEIFQSTVSPKYFTKTLPCANKTPDPSSEQSLFSFAFLQSKENDIVQTNKDTAIPKGNLFDFGVSIQRHSLQVDNNLETRIADSSHTTKLQSKEDFHALMDKSLYEIELQRRKAIDLSMDRMLQNFGLSPATHFLTEQSLTLGKGIFDQLEIVGQWDNKFILAFDIQSNIFHVFDQHAVHERINYELLLTNVCETLKVRQLLPSLLIQVSERELTVLELKKELFLSWGFKFSTSFYPYEDGLYPVELYSTPVILDEMLTSDDLFEFCHYVDMNLNLPDSQLQPPAIRRIVAFKSCHSSIKFGQALSPEECRNFILELSQTALPFQCAHGRPSIHPVMNLQNVMNLKHHTKNKKYQLKLDNLVDI
jgi:DNA mismatch repair ATPase MutL